MHSMKRFMPVIMLLAACAFSSHNALALPPGGTDEGVPSLGKFTILLTDQITEVTSPLLSDSDTKIGRSDPHFDDDPIDLGGADVCLNSSCTVTDTVADNDFTVVPPSDSNPFDEGPADTEEVHTEIISLNMTDPNGTANAVRAGKPAFSGLEWSIGEVESLALPPGIDFPAESFFDIFVEVDVDYDADGIVDLTLYNKDALLIENGNLLAFPPKVIYIHGNTSRVKMFNKANDCLFGYLIIAGHGINFDINNSADKDAFNTLYD